MIVASCELVPREKESGPRSRVERAAALKAKGYHYRFVTAKDLGLCDGEALQSPLADALIWVWRGYP